ncbi:hypothetical protein [Paludisphaera soli]|uniref:hypothetical protein n=1 Tax=Paludisphaera soli TaxID=2712865 RepID=UPI0013ECB74D|nr:hypothetical protein [Paludisphaera soli]
MHRSVLRAGSFAVTLGLVAASAAHAGELHASAWAYGDGIYDNGQHPKFVVGDTGSGWASASDQIGGEAVDFKVRAGSSATVNLGSGGGIHLNTSTSTATAGAPEASSMAFGQWVDDITLDPAAGTARDDLYLVLRVDGVIRTSPGEPWRSSARSVMQIGRLHGNEDSGVYETDPFGNSASIPITRFAVASLARYDSTDLVEEDGGWVLGRTTRLDPWRLDDFVIHESGPDFVSVSWETIVQVPYMASLGAHRLNIFAVASTYSYAGGSGLADFGSTIRLTDVRLADGRSVSDQVSFASGFRVAAVPEPAGLVSAALGLAGLAGLAGLSRRRDRRRSLAA